MKIKKFAFSIALAIAAIGQASETIVVGSLVELAERASGSGKSIRVEPGLYRMADYLTDEVLAQISAGVDRSHRRPSVPMFIFGGSDNRFDFTDVVIEIDTRLYRKLPQGGYVRCLFVTGNNNTFKGLTIRNAGPNQGSNGNILSIFGNGNQWSDLVLHVYGSHPYGYGDLLGKGGPSLVPLGKQSGIMVGGDDTVLRRCKVFSRAFGHCFYVQGGNNTTLEDCYAEGAMRSTNDMLAETEGTAYELGFRSVYENRDGRFRIVAGYMKSLVEDGFRTYGGGPNGNRTGKVTLVNCSARNTRAGFEISGSEDGGSQTTLDNCLAVGCERGYLLGSNVVVRQSRGDVTHGPLLYLRGGHGSDVELELASGKPVQTVHALATIAGNNHRVRFYSQSPSLDAPSLPIMLGYAMPAHAEMASPILPADTSNVVLINEIARLSVIASDSLGESSIETEGAVVSDADSKRPPPGSW